MATTYYQIVFENGDVEYDKKDTNYLLMDSLLLMLTNVLHAMNVNSKDSQEQQI